MSAAFWKSAPTLRAPADLRESTVNPEAQGGSMKAHLSHGYCRALDVVFLAMAGAFTVGLAMLWFGHTPFSI